VNPERRIDGVEEQAIPLLAVVVICRNEAQWIDGCLASVRAAVGGIGADVVVVDSCSSDGTPDVVRRHPVKLIELRPDAPLSPALGRVVGQAATRSRYLLFVDGDTDIEAPWLQHALDHLESAPDVAGVGGRLAEVHYEHARIVGGIRDIFDTGDRLVEVEELGGTAVYRRTALEQVGSFNPFLSSYEEPELVARLRAAGHHAVRLPLLMGTHRTGRRGSLAELSRRRRENLIKGYGQTLRLALGQPTLPTHLRRMRRHLQFQAALLLAFALVLLAAAWWDVRPLVVLAAGFAALLGLFVMRSRSLLKPLRLLIEWAVWTPPMWRGFFERPRDPALLRPDDVIAWPAEQDERIGS
jgi:GT2 family glycosyltransferase